MNKLGTKLGAITMSAVMALTFAPSAAITSLAADGGLDDAVEAGVENVYVVYNPNSGEHVFTTNHDEVIDLLDAGWGEGDVAWVAPTVAGDPVYRIYNPNVFDPAGNPLGDHHYTTDKAEADKAVAAGWKYDNDGEPIFYSADPEDEPSTAVYCAYNPNAYTTPKYSGAHHLTINETEYDGLVAIGWKGEGAKFYGYEEGYEPGEEDELTVTISNTTPKVADTLVATVVDRNGEDVSDNVTFQWYADDVAIEGATDETLDVTVAMIGSTIKVVVTAENGNTFESEETAEVEADNELSVKIENTEPKVGDILTAIVTPIDADVTYSWTAGDTVVGTEEDLEVTADMLGKKIKVKVTDVDTKETVTSEETDAVEYNAPEIVSATQNAANSFTVYFDADADGIVGVDDITVISEDETDVKKITGLDFSLDGESAVVTVNTPFKDGVVYNITYKDSGAFFEASVGEVASIFIKTTEAEINTKTPIEFVLLDDEGIDITSAIKVDDTCVVTFSGDYSNYENTRASASTVTMSTAKDVCTVTVAYDKNDGVTERVTSSKDITCVPASEKAGVSFFKAVTPKDSEINDTSKCFRFYDPKNSADSAVSVAINKEKIVHFYVQDTDKSAISYDSYEIESADETIANAEIDVATGKWASFKVTGNQKGNVLLVLKATKNGASTTYEIPVVVTTQAVPYKLEVSLSKPSMSNAWDEDYTGKVSMKVLDSKGEKADPDTYTVHDFELITKGRGVDADLKGDALYDGVAATGFKLYATDADKMEAPYTAFAAEGGSYVIEGSVTNLTNGDVITKRVTVNVQELAKEAWILSTAEVEAMYQLNYNDAGGDDTDDITGLTQEETLGYPLITKTEYDKLDAETTLKGHLLNKPANVDTQGAVPALADDYDANEEVSEAGADKLEKTKFTLAYINEDGDAVLIKTADDLLAAVSDDDQTENKTIVKLTNETEADVAVAAGKIAKANVAGLTKATLSPSVLLKVQPKYAARLTLGQDAYAEVAGLTNITNQKGVDTSYSIEMVDSMGFADNNKKTARLAAKMGGLFAGYVNQNGTIGEGMVLPLITKRIINLGVVNAGTTVNQKLDNYWGIGIETFFGKNIATTAEVDTDEDGNNENLTYLFDVNDGTHASDSLNPAVARNVETTFWTVNPEPTNGTADFYTKETDEIKKLADDDFARVGQYKVVFSFWYAKSTKPVEESKTFSVKNDLYVPGVQVKTQTIDSYTQSGWKEAVVSEVDLNNNDPYTYSVIDLEDKTGITINDSKTPAKWAVVTEEGVNFHVPLDRTFKLS